MFKNMQMVFHAHYKHNADVTNFVSNTIRIATMNRLQTFSLYYDCHWMTTSTIITITGVQLQHTVKFRGNF